MFLNSRGDIFHGVAGGNASINNVPFSSGAAGGFFTDPDECFYGNGDDRWLLYIYNMTTGARRKAIEDTANEQFDQSANTIYAGGGVWAAWQGVPSDRRGLYTSTGFRLRDGGLMAVGPDGMLGFKPSYHSNGPTWAVDKAGQEEFAALLAQGIPPDTAMAQLVAKDVIWQVTAGHAYGLQLLGGRRAIWQEFLQIRTFGLPQPVQIGSAWMPHAYLVDGVWWISYFSDEAGTALHPVDSFQGYRLSEPGADCWHDGRVLSTGVLRIGISSGEAEQSGQIRARDINFNEPRIDLRVPKEVPLVLLPPERPLWFGCFNFGNIDTKVLVSEGPGNCHVAVRNIKGVSSRPVIMCSEVESLLTGKYLGGFIEIAGDGDVVEAERQAVEMAKKYRPVVYWDARHWPRWPKLPDGSWLCIQAYQRRAELLASFEEAISWEISAAPAGQRVAIVGQQFTSNASLASELRPLAEALTRLAKKHQNVVALLLFSGYGRATGLQDHPEVLPAWNGYSAALAAPQFKDWQPPKPPEPKPPDPPAFYLKHKEYPMASTEKKIVAIKGTAGKFGRPDLANTGMWADLKLPDGVTPANFRGVVFDRDTPDDFTLPDGTPVSCKFELTKPDSKFGLYHPGVNGYLGLDNTKHGFPHLGMQFYITGPTWGRGAFESICVYDGNQNGKPTGQVEYEDETAGKFVSSAFLIEVL